MWPGMIPILAWPGVMRPGQLGPIRRLFVRARKALTRTMSATGTPSVMHTISGTPASAASMMASAAAGGGTKISAQSAPVAVTASSTVFQTAKPSWVVPPLPGVTPPTTWVPYSWQRAAWKAPSLPVMPCTRTFVVRSTRMLMVGWLRLFALRAHRGGAAPGERDHLLGALAHVVGHHQREPRLGQHLLALLDVGTLGPQHHRELEPELLDRGDDALREPVHSQDAAEDVDEDRLHARIGREDAERVLDLLGGGPAAHVEEVGRLAAGQLDDVHGGHRQPGPVHHAADVAVELDVVEAVLRGLHVERGLLVHVAQGHDVLVAVERVVVEVELGIERDHPPVLRDHQRIDLGQRAVLLEVGPEEAQDQGHALLELLPGEAETEREVARLEGLKPQRGVRPLADDLLRMGGRHLLDLHAARLRGHDHVGAAAAVEGHREVELGGDRRRLLHQHLE